MFYLAPPMTVGLRAASLLAFEVFADEPERACFTPKRYDTKNVGNGGFPEGLVALLIHETRELCYCTPPVWKLFSLA